VPRYDGSFEVMEKMGVVADRLKLPESLKLLPTFHVSYLKPFHKDLEDSERAQMAPLTIQKQFEWGIMKILDYKTLDQHKKNQLTEFLVKWADGQEVS